jgi:hypothetical protein
LRAAESGAHESIRMRDKPHLYNAAAIRARA